MLLDARQSAPTLPSAAPVTLSPTRLLADPSARATAGLGADRRIGLVCPYSLGTPGGVQNHVIGLAGYLTRAGHEVAVLAPGRPDPDTLTRHGLSLDQFTSTGGAIALPYNGSVARVSFGPVARARVKRWLDGGFDLVHLHEPITPSIGLHALLTADLPLVATFHTANPLSRTMRLAGRVLSEVIDKIGVRIAVSRTAARMVTEHLGRDSQVIPNGFDFAEFAGVPIQPRVRVGGPRLVFLGRLTEARKGLDVLLDALPTIRAVHPDLEVLVAGQGRRLLPDPCVALGRVSDAERARLLASADVFVAPHVARESFGLVLIEALAAGAPVVASDLAAFVDVLTADGPGRVFPAADPEALAGQVISTLAGSPATLTDQRRSGRSLTRQYDWSEVGPLVEQAYAGALDVTGTDTRSSAAIPVRSR